LKIRSDASVTLRGRLRRREAELLQIEMRRLARRAGLRVARVRIRRVERKLKSSR